MFLISMVCFYQKCNFKNLIYCLYAFVNQYILTEFNSKWVKYSSDQPCALIGYLLHFQDIPTNLTDYKTQCNWTFSHHAYFKGLFSYDCRNKYMCTIILTVIIVQKFREKKRKGNDDENKETAMHSVI